MAVYAVSTAKGPNWDPARGIREQDGWEPHAAFADRLVADGFVILGGPIAGADEKDDEEDDEKDDEKDVALIAVDAANEHEVRSVFDRDPWVVSGVLRIARVRPWSLWLDSRAPAREG